MKNQFRMAGAAPYYCGGWTKFERNPNDERRLQKSHLSRIRTLCSPSPLPSPSVRGSISSAFNNPSRLELLQRGRWFSLSLRERAGVRGNGPWKLKAAGVLQFAHEIRIKLGTHLVQSDFGFSAFVRSSTFGFRVFLTWNAF